MKKEDAKIVSDFKNIVKETSAIGVGVSQGKSGNPVMVVSYQVSY